MSHFLIRLFLILLSLTLSLRDFAAQAQSLPQTETPTEPVTDPEQPLQAPTLPPAIETPAEKPKTRPLRRHIGVGGNIGVSDGDTGLSDSGFAIMTKTDLNDRFSIRGTNVFGSTRNDNAMALTANFPIRSKSGDVQAIPFLGGGVLISSKSFLEEVKVGGLVTGGIDIPLSRRFTLTTAVNAGFSDTTNVGVRLGVMFGF